MGGGIGMGNTCKSMADSFQCMTKPTTIKKINKKKINCNRRVISFAFCVRKEELQYVLECSLRGSGRKSGRI